MTLSDIFNDATIRSRIAGVRAATGADLGAGYKQRAGFAEECRRQSQLLQNDAHEQETTDWLENAGDRKGWQ